MIEKPEGRQDMVDFSKMFVTEIINYFENNYNFVTCKVIGESLDNLKLSISAWDKNQKSYGWYGIPVDINDYIIGIPSYNGYWFDYGFFYWDGFIK